MKSWDFLTKSIRIEGFEDPCIFGHGNEQNPLDNSSLYYVTRASTRYALPACHLKGAGGAFCSLAKGWILVLSRITQKRILWNSAWWYTNTITLYSSVWRMAQFKDHMFGTVGFSVLNVSLLNVCSFSFTKRDAFRFVLSSNHFIFLVH